jgi:hypothetical protein
MAPINELVRQYLQMRDDDRWWRSHNGRFQENNEDITEKRFADRLRIQNNLLNVIRTYLGLGR